MKKVLSLVLSIVLVLLTFASCSEPADPSSSNPSSSNPSSSNPSSSSPTSSNTPTVTLVPVELKISKFEKGSISYSSETELKLKKDNAYQSMTQEYISLPAGAEISSDKEFAVFCFDDSFKIDKSAMEKSGQTLDGFNPTYKSGKLKFDKATIVRLSVKGQLSDVKIEVEPTLKDLVVIGAKDIIACRVELKSVNDFLTQGRSNVNYIYLTDIHYGSEVADRDGDGKRDYDSTQAVAAKLNSLKAYIEKVVTVANNSPDIDFVVVGGDIINGYETPDSNDYKANKNSNPDLTIGKHLVIQHQQVLEPLKKCEKPVFITAGNHDDNNGHSIYYGSKKAEWLLSDYDWNNGVFKKFINVDVERDSAYSYNGESISKYYYYDLKKGGKTTRLIFLDFNDDRFSFDANGEVTGQPNWGGYHEGQLKWLATVALQGKFDECLVFSHQGYINSEGSGIGKDGNPALENILKAYQTKSRIKQPTYTVDFAGRTTGDILLFHHGHNHKAQNRFDYNTRFWEIDTPMMVTQIDVVSVASEEIHKKTLSGSQVTTLMKNGSETKTDM